MEFNHLPFTNGHPNSNKIIIKPKSFEKMKKLAEILSEGIPQVRIDFYDINGNIYNIDSDRSSYATCEHNYIDGTLSRHTKKSDGSCITKFYDSQRCTNCGQLIVGELINTETYTKCPH